MVLSVLSVVLGLVPFYRMYQVICLFAAGAATTAAIVKWCLLAHMIPEGAGHIVLPIISIAALLCLDWRLALASLVTFPLSFVCMGLTFKISGDSFARYDQSSNDMNSAIVEVHRGHRGHQGLWPCGRVV